MAKKKDLPMLPMVSGEKAVALIEEFHKDKVVADTLAAKDWMRSVGLDRQPGEDVKAWRHRCMGWLQQRGKQLKRNRELGIRRAGDFLVGQGRGRAREPGDDDEEIPR